jgi:signal transduction histidine kinase
MSSVLLHKVTAIVLPTRSAQKQDTVPALCHHLRQPMAAIRLLAEARGGNARRQFDGLIGGARDDSPERVDVVHLVALCVHRAQPTATCPIGFVGTDRVVAVASPVALSRAVSCVLDNAVRAAEPGGQVTVEVTSTDSEITIRVIDDRPGLGHVPTINVLGLTITRALVSAVGGGFELKRVPAAAWSHGLCCPI